MYFAARRMWHHWSCVVVVVALTVPTTNAVFEFVRSGLVYHKQGTFEDTPVFWYAVELKSRHFHCTSLDNTMFGGCVTTFFSNPEYNVLASNLQSSCAFTFLRSYTALRTRTMKYCDEMRFSPIVDAAYAATTGCPFQDQLNQICNDMEVTRRALATASTPALRCSSVQCNDRFTELSGVVKSPRFPCGYPRDVGPLCTMTIQGPTRYARINFTIESLDVRCNDMFRIYDGLLTRTITGPGCGSTIPTGITRTSRTSTLIIALSVDLLSKVSGQGFNVSYTILP